MQVDRLRPVTPNTYAGWGTCLPCNAPYDASWTREDNQRTRSWTRWTRTEMALGRRCQIALVRWVLRSTLRGRALCMRNRSERCQECAV